MAAEVPERPADGETDHPEARPTIDAPAPSLDTAVPQE